MSGHQESIAAILTEMRCYAHGFNAAHRLPMSFSTFRQYIDRIEAAWMREKKAYVSELFKERGMT